MSDFAVLFPGQGSQSKNMLIDIIETSDICKKVFVSASECLGLDIIDIIKNREGELNSTEITQPAMLAADIGIWNILQDSHFTNNPPSSLAGHSLGEYSALVAAEVIGFEDAIKIVNLRGKFMKEAVSDIETNMAAIVGLQSDKVSSVCEKLQKAGKKVFAVNFNSREQTVIAGIKSDVEEASALCLENGAKKAVFLPVSVPSHCPLMDPAKIKLASEINKITVSDAKIDIYQNVNSKPCKNSKELIENIIKQLSSPVLWFQTIDNIQLKNTRNFIECGAGRVLSGLARYINKDLVMCATNNLSNLEKTKLLLENNFIK
jgi:[acyl-carrier-protein] S-malonyltransferase